MKRFTLLSLLIITLLLSSCHKQEKNVGSTRPAKPGKVLTILTLDRIRNTSLLRHIVPPFEAAHRCRVEIVSVAGTSELKSTYTKAIDDKKYDLVLGLDNNFFTNDDEALNSLEETDILRKTPVTPTFVFDDKHRILPYGYGYLTLLYNEEKITDPPVSFGQLQDAEYLNQLVVCDPRSSGIGRATLYWSIALFGNDGYQQFWRSIRKNIHSQKETWQEAVASLESRETNMTFGFTSTPAWILETRPNPLPIKGSLMKEGSFLYIEGFAIPKKARHKSLAEDFGSYMLSPSAQRYIPYDLGIFPTNESTPLPAHFSSVPFTTFTVNDRLKTENISANINNWLDFWDRLFNSAMLGLHRVLHPAIT